MALSASQQFATSGVEGVKMCCVSLIADCQNTFALITKRIGEKEKMYAFCIIEHIADGDKEDFLMCLSKAICSNVCRTDYVSDILTYVCLMWFLYVLS